MKNWERRYRRAVARFVNISDDIPEERIMIAVEGSDGYQYSSYTMEDPSIAVVVQVLTSDAEDAATVDYRTVEGPEDVARLIRSFMAGAAS